MPGPVYLGRIRLGWCRDCNLPILDADRCACGGPVVPVALTPPGDAYPAVGRSLEDLKSLLDHSYGKGSGEHLLPENKLVVFNSIPARDRAIEVVLDGKVIGRCFFDPYEGEWIFKPTLEGAKRLVRFTRARTVTADEGAVRAILNGGSLLAPGVLYADAAIMPGDEVTLLDSDWNAFAVGSARMSGADMVDNRRGIACKVREVGSITGPRILPAGQWWGDAVAANEVQLGELESEAIDFISRMASGHNLPACVAFSGGKDSLCTLLLASKALGDFRILFVDTGIEFPETVEYTHRVLASLGMTDRLVERSVGDAFWDAMEIFGPPSRDARWCCKVCKLGPTTRIIQEEFGGGCLTFVGQRRYESQQRQSRRRVSRNPWVPGQLSASPIREWTALHVWLYIFREGVEMNPLYYGGYSRIGCSVCPASDLAELALLSETHPAIARRLEDALREHAAARGMPEEWLDLGLWRWRRPPPWARADLPAIRGFEYIRPPRFRESQTDSGQLLTAELDGKLDLERLSNSLRPIGDLKPTPNGLAGESEGIRVEIRANGEIALGPVGERHKASKLAQNLAACIVRSEHCVGCGTCVGSCHRDCVTIRDGKAWIADGCTHCGSCLWLCPLLTWAVGEPSKPFG